MNNKVHVKTGDEVIVINGKYRGQKGKVLEVAPSEGKIIVEGINIITKHVKPRKMGEAGGLIKAESALYADKVQLVCPKCGKATRVGHAVKKYAFARSAALSLNKKEGAKPYGKT